MRLLAWGCPRRESRVEKGESGVQGTGHSRGRARLAQFPEKLRRAALWGMEPLMLSQGNQVQSS